MNPRILTCALSMVIGLATVRQSFALPLIAALDGNKISSLNTGAELHEARTKMIEEAEHSIYFSSFSVSADDIGKMMAKSLCEKARKGVEVRLLIDHRQSKSYYEISHALRDCGAYVINFRPGNRLYAIHEKLLIVDGKRAIVGGSGISHKYSNHAPDSHRPVFRRIHKLKRGWYDKDYLLEGPAACSFHHQYQTNFKSMVKHVALYDHEMYWYGWNNYRELMPKIFGLKKFGPCQSVAKVGTQKALATLGNPYKNEKRPILDNHLEAIEVAIKSGKKTEFMMYAPYFVPHKKWVKAIEKALDAGIEVIVLTNGISSNDESGMIARILFLAMEKRIFGLLDKGLKVYLWEKESTLHRKGGLYGDWLYFGSDNLDVRAQEWQSESVIFTDSKALVEEHKKEFERDKKAMREMNDEDVAMVKSKASKLEKWVAGKIIDLL